MKKFTIALILIMIGWVGIALVTANPSSADDTIPDDRPTAEERTTCNAEIRADKGYTSHPGEGKYQFDQSLWYQKCWSWNGDPISPIISRNRVNGYRVCMTRLEGNDTFYNYWRVNPDQIGSWDPGMRTFPNDGPKTVCEVWGAGQDAETWVRESANIVFKCIHSKLTQQSNFFQDWQDRTNEICMTFL